MHPSLKSVGLTLLLICSTTVALCVSASMGRSPALAQTTTAQDRKAEAVGAALREANRLFEQGTKQQGQNQSEAAIATLQQALTLYRELKDGAGEGRTLKSIGNVYLDLKDYANALDYQQQALTIARDIQDRDLEARALNNIGVTYKKLKQLEPAITYYKNSLAVSRNAQNFQLVIIASSNLATVYNEQKNYPKAIAVLQAALPAARSSSDRLSEAKFLNFIGKNFADAQDAAQAILAYQQGLAIAQDLKDYVIEADTLLALGKLYTVQQKYQLAVKAYQQATAAANQANDSQQQIAALNQIASIYLYSLKEHQKGVEIYQKIIAVAKRASDFKQEAMALSSIAYIYQISLKDSRKATETYQQAIQVYRQEVTAAANVKDAQRQITALNAIAAIYIYSFKENQKGIEVYQQIIAVAKQANDFKAEVIALNSIASIYQNSLKQPQKAIVIYQQALRLAQKTNNNDRSQEFWLLNSLAGLYKSLKNFPKAIETYQQIAVVAREMKNSFYETAAPGAIGDLYSDQLKQYRKAIDYYQQTLTLAEKYQYQWAQSSALLGIANASRLLATSKTDHQNVLKLAQQGLQIAQSEKNQPRQIRALAILGMTYKALEDYPQAIAAFEQGIAVARGAQLDYYESIFLDGIADIYAQELDDDAKALDYAQQALTTARQVKDSEQKLFAEAQALMSLSGAFGDLGDYPKSSGYAQQLKTIAQQANNRIHESLALILLTIAYYGQENSQVEQIAQQSLTVAEQTKTPELEALAVWCLGWLYADAENYTKAMDFAQRSLTIASKVKNSALEARAYYLLGSIYRKQGKPDQAIAAYRATLAKDDNVYGAKVGLAQVYQQLEMPITAISYYKQAVNHFETTRSKVRVLSTELEKSFLQSIQGLNHQKTTDVYRQLADLLLSQGRILEAQQVLELLKAQEIRDFTRAGNQRADLEYTDLERKIKQEHGSLVAFVRKVYDCKQTSCRELSQLNDQLEVLQNRYNTIASSIEKDRSRNNDPSAINPTERDKIDAILKAQPNTALIYPFVQDDKIWLLWATGEGVFVSQPIRVTQKELGQTVLKFRQALDDPSASEQVKAIGQQLYTWLVQPLATELQKNGIKQLVFAPDRVTRYIPMAALFDGKHYLIENYTISTVLSAGLTKLDDRLMTDRNQTSVLAVGASTFKDLSPLPNVPLELDAIVQQKTNGTNGIYPGQKYLNQAFDRRTLRDKLFGHKILHIATHAAFRSGRPEDSFLVTGTEEKLTIPEVGALSDLKNIHLVVLSACETALGGFDQDGLEISGLSSYFLKGGAAAVIASLWSVNDSSTSALMQQFYQNLSTGKMTKAEALRQAQLSLLQGKLNAKDASQRSPTLVPLGSPPSQRSQASDFSHPYYWAPFILIGNGS
jgi:CHAT domain-containing protein